MGAIPALMLAAAAATQYVYPVDSVLAELKTVCFRDGRYAEGPKRGGPPSSALSLWARAAKDGGWTEIYDGAAELSHADRFALERISTLNASLFGGVVEKNRYIRPIKQALGGQVFKKVVAGRALYLSTFGYDDGTDTVGECRIHDLLGDGLSKDPISERDVQKIAVGKIKKSKGPFESDRYRWQPKEGRISELDVHFGFKGWGITPFSDKVRNFDPYAPYGLTLVAGFHEQVILV